MMVSGLNTTSIFSVIIVCKKERCRVMAKRTKSVSLYSYEPIFQPFQEGALWMFS